MLILPGDLLRSSEGAFAPRARQSACPLRQQANREQSSAIDEELTSIIDLFLDSLENFLRAAQQATHPESAGVINITKFKSDTSTLDLSSRISSPLLPHPPPPPQCAYLMGMLSLTFVETFGGGLTL